MLLAETVFQSMDGSLSFMGILLFLLLGVAFIAGLSIEITLARLAHYAKAILEELKTQNAALKYLSDRAYTAETKPSPTPPPMPKQTPRQSEAATARKDEPNVYRID